jgi:hypothetical protein
MKLSNWIVFLTLVCYVSSLSILFWNLRTFGVHRASHEHGIELSKIASSFDIILFAEIKDAECAKERPFMCPMKSFFTKYLPEHQIYLSPPLHYCDQSAAGSEQYGILLKHIPYEPIHYEDKECLFIRPPYGVRIHYEGQTLVILVFHSHPGSKEELIGLEKVFAYFGNENVLMLGDLNTGCHYITFQELERYPIGSNYTWVLGKNDFTNLEKSCPYDRIVSTQDPSFRVKSAQVLKQYREAERIGSDHYPICVTV